MDRKVLNKISDTAGVVVGTLCATAVLITLILSHWPEQEIVGFIGVLALQVPTLITVFKHGRELKQDTSTIQGQLNGQLDARIQAAVTAAIQSVNPPNGQTPGTPTGPPVG